MRLLLCCLWFLLPSPVMAAVGSLEELNRRHIEAFDDPRRFRLELEETLKTVDQAKDPAFWAALHAYAGEAGWFQEQNDVAKAHVEAALPFALERGLLAQAAILSYVKGGILEYDALNEEAESFYVKAVAIAQQTQDPALIAYTSNAAGCFFHRIGKGDRAAEVYKGVLSVLSQLPRDVIYYDMLASIGTLYTQAIGVRRGEGIRMVRESLEQVRARKARYVTYWLSQALVRIVGKDSQGDEIEELFELCLQMARELNYENYIASTHLDRGLLRFEKQRFAEARSDLEWARNYYRRHGISFYNIPIVAHLGRVYVALKEYERIPELLRDFPDVIHSANSLPQKIEIQTMLQEYYRATGQKDNELQSLRELLEITRQRAGEKTAEEIGRLTRDMEVQRQQYVNENLSAANREAQVEIERRERAQKFLASIIVLAALALGASTISLRRGREIKRQRSDLKLILDNVEEGILRFGADFVIHRGYSRFSMTILRQSTALEGRNIWDLLFANARNNADEKQLWREAFGVTFGETRLGWDLNEGNLPRRLLMDERCSHWSGLGLDLMERRKTPRLLQDLQSLNVPTDALPHAGEPDWIHDEASAMGTFYVMEGSTLGGQVISRHVARILGLNPKRGLAFFSSYGDEVGARWKETREALLHFEAQTAAADTIVDAAKKTFMALASWLDAESGAQTWNRDVQKRAATAIIGEETHIASQLDRNVTDGGKANAAP